ncbi:hypothetical protein ACTFBT_01185 [Streptomyces microflavus]|uniref:Uncharacterized protein n=1 Tax=Streptomyces microflavus TaxID=1919 RepID=A0A7J0D4W3_STRMI|nr:MULTISPECIES: hypothetical protein [Streptomyces]MDX2978159.1 hypothetical protein [Streptomyces sp. NRRL_B-2249]GFN09549.1 hypothetical protein Smic_81050 [Streptomyces microflavus]GGX67229.1 hypothetical protein GCM10010298_34950 [Streptomyces microflavus]
MTSFIKTPAQRAEEAREAKAGAALAAFATALLLLPLLAFILMLVFGAIHGAFTVWPAIGYGTSVLYILGIDLVAFLSKRFRK